MHAPLGRKSRHFVAAGLMALLGAVSAYTGTAAAQGGPGGGPGGGQMPPPEVVVRAVQPKDMPLSYEFAGRVNGSREVEIRARVAGILLERTYTEGETVKQGDLLFLIDPAPYEAAVARAEAMVQQEQARLAQAEREWKRIASLFERNAVSARERDETLSTLELARATVAGARAELRTARINLDYTKVEAPISGVTSLEVLSEGSLVGTGMDNSLLTRITQLDPVYVNFGVPDAEMIALYNLMDSGALRMQSRDKIAVQVKLGSGVMHPQNGMVNFTDSSIDPQTGTIRMRASVPNPDKRLLPGQFVRIALQDIVLKDAIAVPQASVLQAAQGMIVYVVNDKSVAEPRPVRIGQALGSEWVIREGLKPGERVVTEGMIKVRPGAPVKVVEPAQAANQESGKAAPGQGNR